MKQEAYFCRVKELNELGKENIPKQLISHTHLIYSSPATLAFNSPGAEARRSGGAGFDYADCISGMLRTQYFGSQLHGGVS